MKLIGLVGVLTIPILCRWGMAQGNAAESVTTQPIPQYDFKLGDSQTLPIGQHGSLVSAIFGCGADGSVFVQVISPPIPGGRSGDIALYAVRGSDDVIEFRAVQVSGFRLISPITRYFVGDSQIAALAYGSPIDVGESSSSPQPSQPISVLLVFDRKGTLVKAKALDPTLHPEQIAMFPSGDILLVAWDNSHQQTQLLLLDSDGSVKHEFKVQSDDPAIKSQSFPLTGLEIRAYGNNLLLIPEDTHQPVMEVNEGGIVNTHTLHLPEGFSRGLPISLNARSWKFRMIPREADRSSSAAKDGEDRAGLSALQSTPGVLIDFNPSSGTVMNEYKLPGGGYEPACETTTGDFVFLTARASDGKLQLVKGIPVPR